jgi:hypothetical protein
MAIQLRTIIPDKPMRLRLKNLNLQQNEVAEGGVELEFRDKDRTHVGDLIIIPTKLIWNAGKKSKTGKTINWPQFFKMMNTL